MFDNREQVKKVLDVVFPQLPVEDSFTFLMSALLDERRTASHAMGDAPGLEVAQNGGWGASDLVHGRTNRNSGYVLLEMHRMTTAHLRALDSIPPAEAHLVDEIFGSTGMVLVSSGSGSGKTSVLSQLRNFADRMARASGPETFAAQSPLLTVDMQAADSELKTFDPDSAKQGEQVDRALGIFAQHLDALLGGLTDSALAAAFEAEDVGRNTPTGLASEGTRIRNLLANAVSSRYGCDRPNGFVKQALADVDVGESANTRITTRLLMLAGLAKLHSQRSAFGLVLAIDNIDPFPEYVQAALINALRTSVYALRPPRLTMPIGFTIAVFARISTARRHIGALDGVPVRKVEYRAPDPAEVVFFRLAAMLIAPDRVPGFTDLSERDQHRIVIRSIALFERLLDTRDQFYRVFSGLAGSNIRTACKFAKKWILSQRLPTIEFDALPTDGSQIQRLVAVGVLLRCALGLERAIHARSDEDDSQDFVKALCGRVESKLVDLVATSRILLDGPGIEMGSASLRTLTSTALAIPISAVLREEVLSADIFTPVARAASETAVAWGFSSDQRADLAKAVEDRLHASVALADGASWAVGAMRNSMIGAMREGVHGEVSASTRDFLASVRLTDIPHSPVRPNRWESIHLLLREPELTATSGVDPTDADERLSAVNVFSVDGRTFAPVALYILGAVGGAGRRGIDGASLHNRLRLWGFSEEDVQQAETTMVAVNCRLIFSGVQDARIGVRMWGDGSHNILISNAGREYLEAVIPTAAYLQWALCDECRLDADEQNETIGQSRPLPILGGLARIEKTLNALQVVAADETMRLARYSSGNYLPFDPSLCPFCWVFFRGLEGFVEDLVRLRKADPDGSRRIADAYLTFAKALLAERTAKFQVSPVRWEEEIARTEFMIQTKFT